MSDSTTGTGGSGTGPGNFVPPTVEELDAVLDAYEFVEILGKGGMGAVYKARQIALDRLVAIKLLPRIDDGDELRFADRFQREAQAMGRLSHPNIVGVYDFGRTRDGQLYIVMEYVDGTDLHQLIRTGQLTPEHLFGWMPQVCAALQYAHGQGIVHRDIKPANIMINREGVVKVADFGLAKLTGTADTQNTRLTMTNVAMGTPDYVAPESLEVGIEPDHRADLYAIGVILYEMLTGKIPRGAWRPPSVLKPGVDPRFDALINRALDADRDSRFQSASEIGTQLSIIHSTPAGTAVETPSGRKLIVSGPAGTAPESGPVASASAGASSGGKPSTRMRPGAPGNSRRGLPWTIGIGAALVLVGLIAFLAIDMKRADHRVADAIAAAAGGPDLTLPPSTPAPAKPEPTPKSKPAPEPAAHPVPEPAKVEPATAEPGPQPSPSPSPEPEKPSDPTPTPDPAAAPAPEEKTQPAPAAPKSKPGTPALPEDTRLAELEKGFRAAFERDANQAFLGALEQLDQGYLRAVERARTAARKNGNLDEVTALDSEKTRMTAGPGVPPADNPGIPASLISLRKTYREAVGKLEATRDEKTAPLYEKYLVALDAYESELTRANRIENALAVREFRKTIVARRSRLKLPAEMAKAGDAPASMPADADAASEVKIVTSSGYRELATWILSEGGWIRIVQDGREIDIRPENAEALPNGRFSVTEAHLTPPEMKDLTDDDFSRFTAAPDLRILELARCPLRHFPALRVMKKLVSARFGQCPNLTDELFADLGKLPVLEDFYFSNEGVPQTSLTGLALDHLAKGKALKAVGLENPPFSDAELAKLAKIPTLETLNLSRSSEVNGSFLDAFAGHPALASLGLSYLDGARFDVARLASLSDVPTLSRLQMDVFTVSAEGFRAIGKLTSLKWLYCQPAPGVGDEDLAALAGLSVLEDLKIDRPQFTGTGVRSLTCGQTLRYLSFFDGPALSNEGLAAVGETFPNLQWLTFSGPDIDSSGLAALTKLSSLQTIEIRSDSLDDEALAAFAAMKKLGRLDLYSANNQFTAAGLKELAKSKSIEYLDISVPKLDGEGWKTLATFPALNTLFLHDSPITPEGVGELARLKSLQHLMLTAEEGDLSDEIVEPLRGLKRLRTLDLAGAIFRKNPDLVKRIREALPAVEVRG